MKRVFMVGAILAFCFQISNAQEIVKRRSDRKIIELKKIISLSTTQEELIRNAYEEMSISSDSILYHEQDPVQAATLKRKAEKKFNTSLMSSLSEGQRNEYIRITSTPEVMEKAQAKVDVLKESGNYTDAQLDSAKTQIFNYLMMEKVVYKRDKYDYKKQKRNIAQLKKLKPTSLAKAENYEKLKAQGRHYQGRIQW